MSTISIDIPEESWERIGPEDDYESRLLTTVCINGIHHHLEAIAVKAEGYVQKVVNPMHEDIFRGIQTAAEPDGPYRVTEIFGREYVLLMTPHC